MDAIWQALLKEWRVEMPGVDLVVRVTVRLVMAALLAGVIGLNRQREHKAAGLRTHMLVSLGAALFTLSVQGIGSPGDVSRIVQGIAAGIGFIGGGSIFLAPDHQKVKGLTTAASVWLTAAVGVAAGLGQLPLSCIGIFLGWLILTVMHQWESRFNRPAAAPPPSASLTAAPPAPGSPVP